MPDRDWVAPLDYPFTRLRGELWLENGDVDAFRIQLEYDTAADLLNPFTAEQWVAVARFDHTPNSPAGHDIQEEGLHLDLCDGAGVARKERGFPQVPLNHAPRWCEEFLRDKHDELLRGYEQRCGFSPDERNYL